MKWFIQFDDDRGDNNYETLKYKSLFDAAQNCLFPPETTKHKVSPLYWQINEETEVTLVAIPAREDHHRKPEISLTICAKRNMQSQQCSLKLNTDFYGMSAYFNM